MLDRKYFKTDKAYNRQKYMSLQIIDVLLYFVQYCEERGIPICITETVTTRNEDILQGRSKDQHRRGVAFDARAKNHTASQKLSIKKALDEKFKSMMVYTNTGMKYIVYIHGEGDNEHYHIAVHAKYKLPEYEGE